MESDAVWQHIDSQRLEIACLIEEIDARDPAQSVARRSAMAGPCVMSPRI